MTTFSGTPRPAYVYDAANDQWVPVGFGPHTHAVTDVTNAVSAVGGYTIISATASTKPLVIRGTTSQSANLLEFQNSSSTVLTSVDPSGNLTVGGRFIAGGVVTGAAPSSAEIYVNNGSNENIGNPTWGGSLVINEYSTSLNANMGLEFKTRADSNGFGWRISSLANNADLVFESRAASATWSEKLRFDNSGNVGIGYAAPNTKLEVRSASAAIDSYGLVTIGSNNFGIDNGGSLSFAGVTSSDNNQSNFIPYAQISGRKENSTSGNYAGYLSFATRINTGAITERMRIQSNGSISVQSGNVMYFQNSINTGSGSVYCPGGGSLTLAAYNQPMIVLSEDSSIQFKVGSGTDRARIESNGYLLIGYTSSNGAYRLQVNSQIFATSSSIATSDGRYKENVEDLTGGLDVIKALRPVEFNWKAQEDIVVDEKVVREAHSFPEGKTVGFIAQEVQEALADKPWVNNLIKENSRDAVLDADGNELAPKEDFLGIAETNLIAVLVSAVKELTAKVEALEARLD
jgi:hypothetical protein